MKKNIIQILIGLTPAGVTHFNDCLQTRDYRIVDERPNPPPSQPDDPNSFVTSYHLDDDQLKLLDRLLTWPLKREDAAKVNAALKDHNMRLQWCEHAHVWHDL